jgi:CMP-N,N'-diacetyllegionaminic acid synthase
MSELKTYVFDLDNTLCKTCKKENGDWDYLNSSPYVDRIKKVNELWEQGNRIIIETARGSSSRINWYQETFDKLISWGLKFHELRTGVKFSADFFSV